MRKSSLSQTHSLNLVLQVSKRSPMLRVQTRNHPKRSSGQINIDKSRQEMTVFVDGIEQHTWPVSTGAPGYPTPSGNFTASSMNEVWYSKEWDNAPMPNSIFFTKEGHAIHGSYETKKLGRAVSHGCVRLAPENAKALYALIKEHGLENTKVALSGVTPGGEAKVASRPPLKNEIVNLRPRAMTPARLLFPWATRRGLFARRWSGDRYYDGPTVLQPTPRLLSAGISALRRVKIPSLEAGLHHQGPPLRSLRS